MFLLHAIYHAVDVSRIAEPLRTALAVSGIEKALPVRPSSYVLVQSCAQNQYVASRGEVEWKYSYSMSIGHLRAKVKKKTKGAKSSRLDRIHW
jgi:hypothetical protein